MSKNILVIGGTGALGASLVRQLLAAGHAVTVATRGRTADAFGDRIRRIAVDRHDAAAMSTAFAHASFDVVTDLLNRSPLDARIALDVFKGKVQRYVMASSLAVYRQQMGRQHARFAENSFDVFKEAVDWQRDWNDPIDARENHAPGLRQAEAALYQDGGLPTVSVRLAHVVEGGPDDALAYYVELAQSGQALLYANGKATTSFIDLESAASFLHWSAMQAFAGPVNAASGGQLSALGLQRRVGQVLGLPVRALPLSTQANLSPFDYPYPLVLDTVHASELGYRFNRLDGWLDVLIHQYQPDLVSQPGRLPEPQADACAPRRPAGGTTITAPATS